MATTPSKAGQLRITKDSSRTLDALTLRLIGMVDLFSYPMLKKELVEWQSDGNESSLVLTSTAPITWVLPAGP